MLPEVLDNLVLLGLAPCCGGFAFLLRGVFLVSLPVVLAVVKSSFEQLDDFLNLGLGISF